jgi:hypothetical protein
VVVKGTLNTVREIGQTATGRNDLSPFCSRREWREIRLLAIGRDFLGEVRSG